MCLQGGLVIDPSVGLDADVAIVAGKIANDRS
jgi:hypothetical protein